jgi:hypothetical protein
MTQDDDSDSGDFDFAGCLEDAPPLKAADGDDSNSDEYNDVNNISDEDADADSVDWVGGDDNADGGDDDNDDDDDDDDDDSFAKGNTRRNRKRARAQRQSVSTTNEQASGRTQFSQEENELIEAAFRENRSVSQSRLGQLAEQCNQLRVARNAPIITGKNIQIKFATLKTRDRQSSPAVAPLPLTDALVQEVVGATRASWAGVCDPADSFIVDDFLFRHGARIFASFLEKDQDGARSLIHSWLAPLYADSLKYYQERNAHAGQVVRALRPGTARVKFQVAREVEIYSANAWPLPDDAPVMQFARRLSAFVAKRHALPALVSVAAVGDVDASAVGIARSALSDLLPELVLSSLAKRTVLAMVAVLKLNEQWQPRPADAVFLTSLVTLDRASALSGPAMLAVVFQKAVLVVHSAYAMVLRRHRAQASSTPGWQLTAEAAVARGSNFEGENNAYISDRDMGDVHYIAGAAIFLFTTRLNRALIDEEVHVRIFRTLLVSRQLAADDAAKSDAAAKVYNKSLALQQFDGLRFCRMTAFTNVFLPIAKRFFSLPAVVRVAHYVALTELTRGDQWRRFVSTLVVNHVMSSIDDNFVIAHGQTIKAFVTDGICAKFVRILLSIRFKKLQDAVARADEATRGHRYR